MRSHSETNRGLTEAIRARKKRKGPADGHEPPPSKFPGRTRVLPGQLDFRGNEHKGES